MSRAATWIFLVALLSVTAYAQLESPGAHISLGLPSDQTPASPGWPFGPPGNHVTLQGALVRSDGETLSVELRDHRVIRFKLNERTRYRPDGAPEKLSTFRTADVAAVESEVDAKGYLIARSVRFVRKASLEEKTEILESPEASQRWRENVLTNDGLELPEDDRRLNLVAKPKAIRDPEERAASSLRNTGFFRPTSEKESESAFTTSDEDLISNARIAVNDEFERLPNFRAKQVTSLFHSVSKPIKWIPDDVVAAEISYEDEHESYGDIRIDGKRPGNAPATADADYMRSLDKAWSTGDFETLSHCVFSELADADFQKVRTEHSDRGDLAVYEFMRPRPSICIGVLFKSEIAYPAYKGLMKISAQTSEVVHVELEATNMPAAFPLDRAERSADLQQIEIGGAQYPLPVTAYWFGCFRNSYSCFLNRMDFRDYRVFEANSTVQFGDNR